MKTTLLGLAALVVTCKIGAMSGRADPAIETLTPRPIEMRDLIDFLDLSLWKVQLRSDEPFNSIDVILQRHERTGNAFAVRPIGQSHGLVSLQKRSEQMVAVLWKKEDQRVRFQVSFPGQTRVDYTLPADVLADYVPVTADGGPGLEIEGDRIIAVKWRKNEHGETIGSGKDAMDGYIAVKIELRALKGLGD